MAFCEDCRWFQEPGDRCASPHVGTEVIPLLHGKRIIDFDAMDVRFIRFVRDFCGPEGRWFQEKFDGD